MATRDDSRMARRIARDPVGGVLPEAPERHFPVTRRSSSSPPTSADATTMHRNLFVPLLLALLVGCGSEQSAPAPGAPDPSEDDFAELQERGRVAMGVDQYTSTHLFDALPDGGRIALQRNADDPAGVATIRQHLRDIAAAFAAGDFRIPGFVHAGEVPGTDVMARKRERIRYTYSDLPRGGELRLTTDDAEAVGAIHEFMAFQRLDHRAGGHGH
jgi:hypothetical protein